MKHWTQWRRNGILARNAIPEDAWQETLARLPVLDGLSSEELGRLRDWVVLFLHGKQISGAAGLAVSDEIRLAIAAQACLLILNLDLDYYDGWVEVIVYPDEFMPRHEYMDEFGVAHVTRHPLSGEALDRGPVVLSWADVADAWDDGVNVVIHEFAHKLDMLNGEADGFPPLHRGMSAREWSAVFTEAYEDLCARVDRGQPTAIDPYAAEHPAEFFAVCSETFFETPAALDQGYPQVYRQLTQFYHQDPVRRLL